MEDTEAGARVYGRLLEIHTKLGTHDAEILSLQNGQRDTNASMLRLGDRFEKKIDDLGASVRADVANMLKEMTRLTEANEAERRAAEDRAAVAARGTIEATIARHWKISLAGVAVLCAAVFGAGLQSGRTGVMPVAIDLLRGTN